MEERRVNQERGKGKGGKGREEREREVLLRGSQDYRSIVECPPVDMRSPYLLG